MKKAFYIFSVLLICQLGISQTKVKSIVIETRPQLLNDSTQIDLLVRQNEGAAVGTVKRISWPYLSTIINSVTAGNIKTVGGQSLIGTGNITEVQNSLVASTILAPSVTAVNTALGNKADLVAGKVPLSQINDALLGAVNYQGTYNAATNTPTLPSASGNKGFYYVVNTAGTVSGTSYAVGDWIISNGSTWDKVTQTFPVDSSVIDGSNNAVSGNAVYDALALKANDANVIHTTGNENKNGILTFENTADTTTGSIIVNPSANANVIVSSKSSSGFPLFQLQDSPRGGADWNIENGRQLGTLSFYSSSGQQLSVLQNGNTGFGITNPSYKIDVNGTGRFTDVLRLDSNLNIIGTSYIGFNSNTWTVNHGSGGMNFTKQGTGNALFLKDNLNVGIGTNNPLTRLDVWDNTTGDLITGRVGSIGVSSFTLGGFNTDANNAGIYFKTQRAGVMTEAARILANGNFGINTTNPTSNLHVVGTQRVEGVATFGTGTVNALNTRIVIANDSGSSKLWALSNGLPGNTEGSFGILNLTAGTAPFTIDGASGFASFGTTDTANPITVSGGQTMTSGYNRTFVARDTYPMVALHSTAGTVKLGGISYDSGNGMTFWVNAATNDISGTGVNALTVNNSGTTAFNYDVTGVTPATSDNDTSFATTAFVKNVVTSSYISASPTLSVPSIASHDTAGVVTTVTGAAVGDFVLVTTQSGSLNSSLTLSARVNSANQVTVSINNGQVNGVGSFSLPVYIRVLK